MKLIRSLIAVAGLSLFAGCQGNEGTPGLDRTDSKVATKIPTGNGAGDSAGQVISPQERERVDRIRNGEYVPRSTNTAPNVNDAGAAPRDNVSGTGGSGTGTGGADANRGANNNRGNSGTTATPDRTPPTGR